MCVCELPNSIKKIKRFTFQECSELTNIIIPNSIVKIGNSAFSGCSALTKNVIPNSVKTIHGYVFSFCKKLSYIKYPADCDIDPFWRG